MAFELSDLSKEEIVEYMTEATKFCKNHAFIIEPYAVDFFAHDLWNDIPRDWADYLTDLTFEQLADFIDIIGTAFNDTRMPETLRNLRKVSEKYMLSRHAPKCIERIRLYPKRCDNYSELYDVTLKNLPLYQELRRASSTFSKNFFRRVKAKKRHEINVMSNVTFKSALQTNVDFVVDVGGGVGHLARLLSFAYNIKVLSIDGNHLYTAAAQDLDKKLMKYIKHNFPQCPDIIAKRPIYCTAKIETHITPVEFLNIILTATGLPDANVTFGIIGLHPCGDLASTLLRLYKESPNCIFINIASCCYFKLSTASDVSEPSGGVYGFPMSDVARENGLELSYNVRELSCHWLEQSVERLRKEDVSFLKVHAYRAVLEKLVVDRYPEKCHQQIRSVKFKSGMPFYEFVLLALTGTDTYLSDECIHGSDTEMLLNEWKKVVIFNSFRLMFAPALESIILLDRYLYLNNESGFVNVTSYFNSESSPRTHMLLALKP